MPVPARRRVFALGVSAAIAATASAGLAAAARFGLDLCDRSHSAAETMRMEGMSALSGVATASIGSDDVCPLVVNLALAFAFIAACLAAWLLLGAVAPIAEAVAAAFRAVFAPGPAVPWLAPSAPAVVRAGIRVARRGPSRAPPIR